MFVLVGEKVGMNQMFSSTGEIVPVTVIKALPNQVVYTRTKEKNNYEAVAVGYGEIKKERVNKPLAGQYKNANGEVRRRIYELKGLDVNKYKPGDSIKIEEVIKVGDMIDVQGTTRGHGFTGAIKLWNFRCGPKSHGAGYPHRFRGSLETGRGGSSPQKVWKGKKMSGRYGNELVTISNLEVVYIDLEKHLIFVKGCVPGRAKGILKLKPTTRKNKRAANEFQMHKVKRKEVGENK